MASSEPRPESESIATLKQSPGWLAALEELRLGASEGGLPIGACVVAHNGKILGRGHNMRVQHGSPIFHAETSAMHNSGRIPVSAYAGATMFTTLSPCDMCTGVCLLYGIKRVVLGENVNDPNVRGEEYLRSRGVEVVVLDDEECKETLGRFIRDKGDVWDEAFWGAITAREETSGRLVEAK